MARLELQGCGMRRQTEFGPGRRTLAEKELDYAIVASMLRALPPRSSRVLPARQFRWRQCWWRQCW